MAARAPHLPELERSGVLDLALKRVYLQRMRDFLRIHAEELPPERRREVAGDVHTFQNLVSRIEEDLSRLHRILLAHPELCDE